MADRSRCTEGAGAKVIAITPLLLTTQTFPPVELDHDVIKPKRMMQSRIVTIQVDSVGQSVCPSRSAVKTCDA